MQGICVKLTLSKPKSIQFQLAYLERRGGELVSRRILYIEDNDDNRLLVQRILRAEGFVYEEATNANDGIRMAVENPPDLILMDINMPYFSGLEATQYLRELPELDSTPIVALTANAMRHELEQTIEAGCDGYIIKPIDIDAFVDQIRQYLQY